MSSKIFTLVVAVLGLWLTDHVSYAQTQDKNSTSISTADGCRLYIGDIKFTKFVPNGGKGTSTVVYVDGFNLVNDTSTPDAYCGNDNGSIVLDYSNIQDQNQQVVLDNFTLMFDIQYQAKFRWWQVTSLTLFATGSLIDAGPLQVNWTGALMQSVAMGAGQKFCYACSKPNELSYSQDKETKPTYKLQLLNIQLQPFAWPQSKSGDGFTDYVDDCVPFFSASVWMVLCTMLIFVAVILSGVVMLGNMTTVNRFDDPKSKQLVIIPKD